MFLPHRLWLGIFRQRARCHTGVVHLSASLPRAPDARVESCTDFGQVGYSMWDRLRTHFRREFHELYEIDEPWWPLLDALMSLSTTDEGGIIKIATIEEWPQRFYADCSRMCHFREAPRFLRDARLLYECNEEDIPPGSPSSSTRPELGCDRAILPKYIAGIWGGGCVAIAIPTRRRTARGGPNGSSASDRGDAGKISIKRIRRGVRRVGTSAQGNQKKGVNSIRHGLCFYGFTTLWVLG